jgi:hypothetical protein
VTDDPFLKMLEQNFPDLYADMRKADDELGEISFRLAQVAREVVESKNRVKPPDIAARINTDIQACVNSATSWIKSHYTMIEGLAEEYGKGFMGNEQSKQQFGLVSWAAALSEPQVATALKQAQVAIAQAAVSLTLQGFFMMGGPTRRKEVEAATENMKNAVAAARTIVMGL